MSTGKRGPYARTTERRAQIADAVLAIVDAEGHDAVTTALVAEKSGIAEATVLYHFPTKDHLLVAALQRADDLSELQVDLDVDLDLDLLRQVASEALEGEARRHRLLVVMRGKSATPEHPAVEYFERRLAHSLEIYVRLIERRQKAGLAHPAVDPRSVALQLLALWDGLSTIYYTDESIDLGELLVEGYRRLAGENVMGL